ncbi:hypothetical protein ROR02_18650 [Pararhodospirillum oryzae]|uniref:DUF3035 domain-containing protein n=1 Tax=Pararhodospirillum oryzae TaxID=478448 RepID=A0A512H8F3_9PROT|nr:hypothetical protein ROR02_18650 [Pararhodospirillum oryzae]
MLSLALGVAACGDTKKSLGLERTPPDEFKVVTRAPLAVPPDFSLRPPQPGQARPQEVSTRDQARAALMGRAASGALSDGSASTGEAALLDKAGIDRVQPDIRAVVNREDSVLAEEERTFTDRLVFWRDTDPEAHGRVVDPEAELKRLRENQSLGKPVTEGHTPIIERRERGFLEGLF